MKGRGAFIVFEGECPLLARVRKTARVWLIARAGVDRCGKTTQTKKLVEALAAGKHKVELARFPDRTTQTGHM